nr:MAG TPA: hypothetical protein [Caudoviricetes sp.]
MARVPTSRGHTDYESFFTLSVPGKSWCRR